MQKNEETTESKFSANSIATIILAALFVAAAFQTMQLSGISDRLAGQEAAIVALKAGTSAALPAGTANAQASAQGTQGVPSSLQNLPEMVGGC